MPKLSKCCSIKTITTSMLRNWPPAWPREASMTGPVYKSNTQTEFPPPCSLTSQTCCQPKMERSPPYSFYWRWLTSSPTTSRRLSTVPPRCWTSTTLTSSWRAWRVSTWSCPTSLSPWSRSWWTAGTRSNMESGQVGQGTFNTETSKRLSLQPSEWFVWCRVLF